MRPYIRPAEPADVEYIARRMKRPDIEECAASYGHTPLQALGYSFENSVMRGTVCDHDGEPVLMYGVGAHFAAGTGSPWMLSTAAIYRPRMSRFFLRGTAAVIERMHRHYPLLIQHVDARHAHSLRWMLWAGFEIDKLEPEWGVERIPFFRLSRMHHNV